jgi:hypothetical protein
MIKSVAPLRCRGQNDGQDLRMEGFMGGTNTQAMAELRAQNDRLMANQVMTRNLVKAQNARMDKIELDRTVDQMTSTMNTGLKGVSDAVLAGCHDWLDHQSAMWHGAVEDVQSACHITGVMFEEVMSAQPKPSVLEAAIKGLIIAFTAMQPEFAMIGVVLEIGIAGDDEQQEKTRKKLDKLKEGFKEVYEKFKEAREKGEQIEQHESRLSAKLRFFQDVIDGCSARSSQITEIHFALKHVLRGASTENAPATAKGVYTAWNLLVGEGRPYHRERETPTELARLLLYDLLRAYCKQSVKLYRPLMKVHVPISKADAIRMIASGDGSDIDFDGLDSAKRTVMYEIFERITKWGNRPKITKEDGWKDLIRNWDFAN